MAQAAPVIIAAIGAAVSAYGQAASARTQKKQIQYNQTITERARADALARGEVEAQRHRQKVSILVGRQRALVGASGADLGSGSALDIVEDSYAMGELDVLTIRNNAAREAYGYEVRGQSLMFDEQQARLAQNWGTGANLLGGAASVYSTGRASGLWGNQ